MTGRAARDILTGAVLFLLLCIVAGRPQVFSDTRAYYILGQEIARIVRPGPAEAMAAPQPARQTSPRQTEAASTAAAQRSATQLAYTVAGSRSPYWSVLFYLAVQAGSAWLVVVLQALVAAATVWIAARRFGVGQAYLPIVALLAGLSSLPVQVMFLMPDLFAGLALLAAIALAAGRAPLTRREATALWLVMAAGALFHTSHLLTLGALGAATVVAGVVPRRQRDLLRAGAAMLAAAAVGAVGALAFPVGVQVVRHQPVYAPPFLAARLIADGPGRRLLRTDCRSGAEWSWCAYRDQPLNDVNTILWDSDPADASFQAADYARRVRIIREQPRFVLAVVARYPGVVASDTLRNIVDLFLQYRTTEALDDPTARYRDPKFAVFARIVPGTQGCVDGTASCAPRVGLAVLNMVLGVTLAAAWVVIATVLLSASGRRAWGRSALFLLAGLSLNAIICGGISGNAERYQSRITWLVPLLASAMVADRLARRSAQPLPAASVRRSVRRRG